MSEPDAMIRLEKTAYRPGELLAGAFQITGYSPERYTLELSVLWRSEGKGDEDIVITQYPCDVQGQPNAMGTGQCFDTYSRSGQRLVREQQTIIAGCI